MLVLGTFVFTMFCSCGKIEDVSSSLKGNATGEIGTDSEEMSLAVSNTSDDYKNDGIGDSFE